MENLASSVSLSLLEELKKLKITRKEWTRRLKAVGLEPGYALGLFKQVDDCNEGMDLLTYLSERYFNDATLRLIEKELNNAKKS